MAKRRRTPEEIKKLRETVLKETKKEFIYGSSKNKKKTDNDTSFGKNSFGKNTFGKK